MTEEEIIQKQAHDAVKEADRYGIHLGIERYIRPVMEWSTRLRKPEAKHLFFKEAIRQVQGRLDAHRNVCSKGPECAKDQKYQEILFYLNQEDDLNNTSNTNLMTPSNVEVEKVFISHSSKDVALVEELINMLEGMGVKPKQIFCSSFEGYGVELGQDFLQRIKDELNNQVLVLFVITNNFYNSPISLCEMGATWVKTSKHIPIVVPPLKYEDVKGVIPLTKGLIINEPQKWNSLKEQIERWMEIEHVDTSIWERKRNNIIEVINSKLEKVIK
jgi:hypothetical protein